MAVLIRLAAAEDAAAIAAIYRPYVEQSRISFEEEAPDAVEMAGRMDSPLHPWLLAEEEGRILGYASSSPYHRRPAYRWTVETSIYLAADAQGRGVGRELLSSLVELLARQGYVTAIAAIALPNPISIALHERLGFAPTGTYRGVGFKLGQWTDVSLWQRDLAPRRAMTEAPLPFAQVRHPGLQQGSAFSPTAGRRRPRIRSGVMSFTRQMWMGLPCTAIAASLSASSCVGWA